MVVCYLFLCNLFLQTDTQLLSQIQKIFIFMITFKSFQIRKFSRWDACKNQ